jgi:hypothetical protein
MNNEVGIVYGEVFDEIKVQSMHSPTTKYVIRCGNVSWSKNADFRPVIYVLMEYKGYIEMYTNPPHYMIEPDKNGESDITKVINAMEELKKKFKIK